MFPARVDIVSGAAPTLSASGAMPAGMAVTVPGFASTVAMKVDSVRAAGGDGGGGGVGVPGASAAAATAVVAELLSTAAAATAASDEATAAVGCSAATSCVYDFLGNANITCAVRTYQARGVECTHSLHCFAIHQFSFPNPHAALHTALPPPIRTDPDGPSQGCPFPLLLCPPLSGRGGPGQAPLTQRSTPLCPPSRD